jgi:hypothetical protein
MEEHWVALAKELRDADEELVKNVDDSINSLLVFVRCSVFSLCGESSQHICTQAGLFSAVQSAFAVATYPLLQSPPPTQKASIITINIFVFSSLALALTCAFVSILRKNQLKQYLSWTSKRTDARSKTMHRQFSFELNSSRKLWDSASHISVGLTLSIGLFAVGVFVLLWNLDHCVAGVVFLFVCLTLCVIFSSDLPVYYRRCRSRVRAISRDLFIFSRDLYRRLCDRIRAIRVRYGWYQASFRDLLDSSVVIPGPDMVYYDQAYVRSRRLGEQQFGLLSRAIMSRTSGLTASGVDPNVGHLAQSIVGLGKLPLGTDLLGNPISTGVWRVLALQKIAKAPLVAGLGRVLDSVLAILRDRDPYKGSHTIPLSLWSRVKGCLTRTKPAPQERKLHAIMNTHDSIVVAQIVVAHPWLIWIGTALSELSAEERCLLGDIVSDQIVHTLRVTEPLRRSGSGVNPMPEEPLYSAFCLAQILLSHVPYKGPSDERLRRAIVLAGVRLQFSNPPSRFRFFPTSNSDHSGRMHSAVRFVEWSNQSLQQAINEMVLSLSSRIWFDDDIHRSSHELEDQHHFPHVSCESHLFVEFAINMFLHASLSIDVTSGLSKLSPREWTKSSQGMLFWTVSAHALSILKAWQLESPASVDTRRPEIIRLCLQLTELLRHDIFAQLPPTGMPFDVYELATKDFPWHRCLKGFVAYLPADSEMGALLRYLARVSDKFWLSWFELDVLADLFPPNGEVDYKLQVAISQHLTERNDPSSRPISEDTTPPEVASPCADADTQDSSHVTVGLGSASVPTTVNSLHQLGLPDPGAGEEIDQRATVHASDSGQTSGTPVSSPHCTVDMVLPVQAGFPAPCTSVEANVSVPASGSGGVGSEPGQSHAVRKPGASGVDERHPHVVIDMQPAAQHAPRITSPSEATYEVGGSVELEQNSQ